MNLSASCAAQHARAKMRRDSVCLFAERTAFQGAQASAHNAAGGGGSDAAGHQLSAAGHHRGTPAGSCPAECALFSSCINSSLTLTGSPRDACAGLNAQGGCLSRHYWVSLLVSCMHVRNIASFGFWRDHVSRAAILRSVQLNDSGKMTSKIIKVAVTGLKVMQEHGSKNEDIFCSCSLARQRICAA